MGDGCVWRLPASEEMLCAIGRAQWSALYLNSQMVAVAQRLGVPASEVHGEMGRLRYAMEQRVTATTHPEIATWVHGLQAAINKRNELNHSLLYSRLVGDDYEHGLVYVPKDPSKDHRRFPSPADVLGHARDLEEAALEGNSAYYRAWPATEEATTA